MTGNPFAQSPAPIDDDFSLDLSDPNVTGQLNPGEYSARCVSVEKGISKAGNPQYIWTFVIMDAGAPVEPMKLWTALHPTAIWKAIETLSALGLGEPGQKVSFKATDAVGRLCKAVVVNEAGRVNINKIMPWPEGKGKLWSGINGAAIPSGLPPASPAQPDPAMPPQGFGSIQNEPPTMDEPDDGSNPGPFGHPSVNDKL